MSSHIAKSINSHFAGAIVEGSVGVSTDVEGVVTEPLLVGGEPSVGVVTEPLETVGSVGGSNVGGIVSS